MKTESKQALWKSNFPPRSYEYVIYGLYSMDEELDDGLSAALCTVVFGFCFFGFTDTPLIQPPQLLLLVSRTFDFLSLLLLVLLFIVCPEFTFLLFCFLWIMAWFNTKYSTAQDKSPTGKHFNWTVHHHKPKRELKSFPHMWSFVIKCCLLMSHLFLTPPKESRSTRSDTTVINFTF